MIGLFKIVQYCYLGIIYNLWLGDCLLFIENDVQICLLLLFYVFVVIVLLGVLLLLGVYVVFLMFVGYWGDGVFDNFWKFIEWYKVIFVIIVLIVIVVLMQCLVDVDILLLCLVFCGFVLLFVELYKKFESVVGVIICEGYGLIEVICLVLINLLDGEKKIGFIGFLFLYMDVKIYDYVMYEFCDIDQIGEICVLNLGVLMGYIYIEVLKNVDLYYFGFESQIQYLCIGDFGWIDVDGYFWIIGCVKDLIICFGYNIDFVEIEEVLVGYDKVVFVGVIGQFDSYVGELLCVYVELVDGVEVLEMELMDYVKKYIYECVVYFKYMEILVELLKIVVGKIFKLDLWKMVIKCIFDVEFVKVFWLVEVFEVVDDKKCGLVVCIVKIGDCDVVVVEVKLGEFLICWEWVD